MRRLLSFVHQLLVNQRAATVVEYGLIIAGIVLAIFGAIQSVGGSTGDMWNNISTKVLNAR